MPEYHTHYEYSDIHHDHDDKYEAKSGCLEVFAIASIFPILAILWMFIFIMVDFIGDKTGWWDWKFNEWMNWLLTCAGTYCNG